MLSALGCVVEREPAAVLVVGPAPRRALGYLFSLENRSRASQRVRDPARHILARRSLDQFSWNREAETAYLHCPYRCVGAHRGARLDPRCRWGVIRGRPALVAGRESPLLHVVSGRLRLLLGAASRTANEKTGRAALAGAPLPQRAAFAR